MIMVAGDRTRNMETSGSRAACPVIGRLIAMVIGPMSLPGDGPGLKMSLGDLRPSTMADGRSCKAAGAGSRDRLLSPRSTRRRWLLSSVVEDLASESGLEPSQSDGFR